MSAVPSASRRVLDTLRPGGVGADPSFADATWVTRAFVGVEAALDAHLAALSTLDRIEEAVIATYGHPRVALPGTSTPPTYASDASTIVRRLGHGPATRRLTAEPRRRQETFQQAGRAAGLEVARARETRMAKELSEAAAQLLLAPAHTRSDLALKLTLLIAAGEATADDALAFPWLYLRALHADLHLSAPSP